MPKRTIHVGISLAKSANYLSPTCIDQTHPRVLTQVIVVALVLADLAAQSSQLLQLELLRLHLLAQLAEPLVLGGDLLMAQLLLFEEAQPLFFGDEQLLLRLDLLLLAGRHLLQLGQRQVHSMRQLETKERIWSTLWFEMRHGSQVR